VIERLWISVAVRVHGRRRPKLELNADPELAAFRRRVVRWDANRALTACAAFRGDVLTAESARDDIIPHAVLENYVAALSGARSLTARLFSEADHSLSRKRWQQAYTTLLINWLTEMILGARSEAAAAKVDERRLQHADAGISSTV